RTLQPQLSKADGLIAWLRGGVGEGPLALRMGQYASQLTLWRDDASNLARSPTLDGLIQFLDRGEALLGQALTFTDHLSTMVQHWPEDITQSWSLMVTWLQARTDRPASTTELAAEEETLRILQERIRHCSEEGNLLRAQKQGLDAVIAMLPTWE